MTVEEAHTSTPPTQKAPLAALRYTPMRPGESTKSVRQPHGTHLLPKRMQQNSDNPHGIELNPGIRRILRVALFTIATFYANFFLSYAVPCNTSNLLSEANRCATILATGWSFRFVGNDSAVHYATTLRPDAKNAVTLPHVFPAEKQFHQPASGYGWYCKNIVVSDTLRNVYTALEFEGVTLRAEVFVNGAPAGGCTFAYLPFRIDLTPFIQTARILHIAVRVDSRLRSNEIPDSAARGWWIYGGIGREVSLVTLPRHRIDSVQLRTFHYAQDTFDLHCSLKPARWGRWDSVSLAVFAPATDSTKKHQAAIQTIRGTNARLRIGNIHAWTPADPYRYIVKLTPYFGSKKGSSISINRGFCQLSTKGSQLFLNGKPYYLRGIARHDILRLDGTPLTRKERQIDLVAIKSMGTNFLRIAHFPQHRDVYELCDSIGLLIMDEMPAWKTDPEFLGSQSGAAYGAAYMRNMIAVHGNYTSVVVWSIGNQFKSYKTSVADFVRTVTKAVKQCDPSRLVTFCSYYYLWDKAFLSLDLIAINEYFGWELASLDMLPPLLDQIHKHWPNKPVIVTELGAQAQLGLRNREAKLAGPIKSLLGKDISEDHQALFIAAHMDTIRSRQSFVKGMVVWSYNDYMSHLNKKHAPGTPNGFNGCGVVTAKRERKLSYEQIRKRYTTWLKPAKEKDLGWHYGK